METGGAVYCSARGSWFGTRRIGFALAPVVGTASNKSPNVSELDFLFCETNRIYQNELFEI